MKLIESYTPLRIIFAVYMRLSFLWLRVFPSQKDGWRITTAIHHRNSCARYTGSLFNLNIPGGKGALVPRIVSKLEEVIRQFKPSQYALSVHRFSSKRIEWPFSDFLLHNLDGQGKLTGVDLFADPGYPEENQQLESSMAILQRIFVSAYNQTRIWEDRERGRMLDQLVEKLLVAEYRNEGLNEAKKQMNRLLRSATLFVIQKTKAQEWDIEDFHALRSSTHQSLSFCIHIIDDDRFNLWVQVSHIALDGRIATRLFRRISRTFGKSPRAINIPDDLINCIPEFHRSYKKPEYYEGGTILNLDKFFALHERMMETYGAFHPILLLIWLLSSDPVFDRMKFNIPVDLPEEKKYPSSVGFIFLFPGKIREQYENTDGFRILLDSYKKQFRNARLRRGDNYLLVQTASIMPERSQYLFVKHLGCILEECAGSFSITLLKGVEVVMPSLSDNISFCLTLSLFDARQSHWGFAGYRSFQNNTRQILDAIRRIVSDSQVC
jgi:hypothetical protein